MFIFCCDDNTMKGKIGNISILKRNKTLLQWRRRWPSWGRRAGREIRLPCRSQPAFTRRKLKTLHIATPLRNCSSSIFIMEIFSFLDVPGVVGVGQEGEPGAGVDADDAGGVWGVWGVWTALGDILTVPVTSRHGGDSAPEQINLGNSHCGPQI